MGQALIKPRAVSNTRSAMSVSCLNRWIALFCHLFTIILVIYGPMVNLARSQNQFENPLQHKNVLVLHAHESMAPIFEKPTAHFLRRWHPAELHTDNSFTSFWICDAIPALSTENRLLRSCGCATRGAQWKLSDFQRILRKNWKNFWRKKYADIA